MLKAYSRAVARINSLRTEEEGATATEYALIIGVASIAIVAALALIAPAISHLRPDRHRQQALVWRWSASLGIVTLRPRPRTGAVEAYSS